MLKPWIILASVLLCTVGLLPWVFFNAGSEESNVGSSSTASFQGAAYTNYVFNDDDFWELTSWGVSIAEFAQGFASSIGQKDSGSNTQINFRYAGRVSSGEIDNRVLLSPIGDVTRIETGTKKILGQNLKLEDEVIYLSGEEGDVTELRLFSTEKAAD